MNTKTAQALAADLAGTQVDQNEAQKALAYLRSKRDPKRFFEYLQAVVNNGQAVIRSRQTLDHYCALLQVCQRHLRGMAYEEMATTLGWALRLLRYYRAVPEAEQYRMADPEPGRDASPRQATPSAAEASQPAPSAQTTRSLPEVGGVFTGKVVDGDDDVFVIEVPGFATDKAIALLKREPGVPKFKVGKDKAKVEVVAVRQTKSGKTVLEVRRPG